MLGEGNVEKLGDYVTDDVVDHEPFPGQSDGIDGVREFIEMMRSSFSDIRASMGPSLESGDLASAQVTITAKHTGDFMGVPATEKSIEIEAIDIIRIEDGKCAEHWGVTDMLALLQQIGAVPEPAQA
jgi:predicted ester cyclase